jgi:hypothetical protein
MKIRLPNAAACCLFLATALLLAATPARAGEEVPAFRPGVSLHTTFGWDGIGLKAMVRLEWPQRHLELDAGGFATIYVEGSHLGAELNLLTDLLSEHLLLGAYVALGDYDDYHFDEEVYLAGGAMVQLRLWHFSIVAQGGRFGYFGGRAGYCAKAGVGLSF